MFQPEMIKEHWTTLNPKVRELWPNLTELDVQAINGDGELLVTKVHEKYGIVRGDIFNKLAPYLHLPKLAPLPARAPR
jgi:uncharacterized protein YjbJ (UPF0337 family)